MKKLLISLLVLGFTGAGFAVEDEAAKNCTDVVDSAGEKIKSVVPSETEKQKSESIVK